MKQKYTKPFKPLKSVAIQLKLLHSRSMIILLRRGFVYIFIWGQWYRLLRLSSNFVHVHLMLICIKYSEVDDSPIF